MVNNSTESTGGNSPSLRALVLSNMVTILISVSASYVTILGQDKSSDASIYHSTIQRMNAQDGLIKELRVNQTIADLRIIELEAEIRKKGDYSNVLRAYINGLATPAWVKYRGEDGIFRVYVVNTTFLKVFGRTRHAYEGRQDTDLWPEVYTSVWGKNDLLAYRTGKAIKVYEEAPNSEGKIIGMDVWKFPIILPDGSQGVAGIVISIKKENV